jgi:hypothetical protein
LLLVKTAGDARMDLIFVHCRSLSQKISDIDYVMSDRRISLEEKLQEIEDEYQEKYKIFLSYAKTDSQKFKISEIAQYFEREFNTEVMYFEKSKRSGEDILDYMERGIKWCNVFVWFHSPNSMDSDAVKKEYKMAMYLGKKIISITTDFNALPLSARVTWSMIFNEEYELLCRDIINDLKQYDIHKTKQDW